MSQSALDKDRVDELRALSRPGGTDVLAKLVETFLGELPARVAAVRAAVSSADPAACSGAAHALKGSSATLGAQRLAQVCDQIETAGHAEDIRSAAELLLVLEEEAARAESALVSEIEPRTTESSI